MDINDLTIGQAKELSALFSNTCDPSPASISGSLIGEYVIVRSRNEGINAGYVREADSTGIILEDARRIWYHRPENKSMAWYEGVAISGLSSDSKASEIVGFKAIIEDYSVTACTEAAKKSIQGHKAHGQS